MSEPVLSLRDVRVSFDTANGRLQAVRGVDLDLCRNETVAIVGESGSGKSALARAILRLNQPAFTLNRTHISGEITLHRVGSEVDLARSPVAALRRVRARDIGMIGQDSLSGLNPVWTVGFQIAEALRAAAPRMAGDAVAAATLQVLEAVGLPDPPAIARRYPHQLSGGQRQRIMIATAVVRSPRILIADEPTTALDVTVQARILKLLGELRIRSDMAMLFISHDLAVVAQIADRVAVVYAGQIVEISPVERLINEPRHPYTVALLSMQPGHARAAEEGAWLGGPAPDPFAVPAGCAVSNRCPRAQAICSAPQPWNGAIGDGHRCGRAAP